jgi:hypothetical protein
MLVEEEEKLKRNADRGREGKKNEKHLGEGKWK